MRVSQRDYDLLAQRIAPIDTEEVRERYRNRDIPRGELVNDIDRRYRFDLLYASRTYGEFADGPYTDAHLETALKKIVKPLD